MKIVYNNIRGRQRGNPKPKTIFMQNIYGENICI